ncbi:MAG: hypothetical protein QOD01_775 [Actinomycetota bacterium]|nr:hypothetical protein [Actinomycetota bacterium]
MVSEERGARGRLLSLLAAAVLLQVHTLNVATGFVLESNPYQHVYINDFDGRASQKWQL